MRTTLLAMLAVFMVLFMWAAPAHGWAPVQEDDPRWNCRTMGNQVCGIDPFYGTWSVTRGTHFYV